MKINERELARMSEEKPDMEGRMTYKKINGIYKDRWFKLIDNFLFYFRISDPGKLAEKQVIGVFVLENVLIQVENEQDCSFVFSITFTEEPEKKHLFSCMSEANVSLWVSKLQCASYEHLRTQLYLLQWNIYMKTGKDPLLMVPRNAGSMNWAPGQPLPIKVVPKDLSQPLINIPGYSINMSNKLTSSSVYRSKSSANVASKVTASNGNSPLEQSWSGSSLVERSKTTSHFFLGDQFNDLKLNSHVPKLYNRPAPSPPPRKKNSPHLQRNGIIANQTRDDFVFVEDLSITLSQPPLPPQRRNSPKIGLANTQTNSNELSKTKNNEIVTCSAEDDLIKF